MSGKREVCRQQLSLKFQQKKVMKKYKMTKMPQKSEKQASNQAENGHGQHFRKILQLLVKIQFQQLRRESCLHKKNQRIDFSLFSHL